MIFYVNLIFLLYLMNNNIYNHNNDDILEIYKGEYFSKPRRSRAKQVIVFDLDETLGSFAD